MSHKFYEVYWDTIHWLVQSLESCAFFQGPSRPSGEFTGFGNTRTSVLFHIQVHLCSLFCCPKLELPGLYSLEKSSSSANGKSSKQRSHLWRSQRKPSAFFTQLRNWFYLIHLGWHSHELESDTTLKNQINKISNSNNNHECITVMCFLHIQVGLVHLWQNRFQTDSLTQQELAGTNKWYEPTLLNRHMFSCWHMVVGCIGQHSSTKHL
jgi:hypothetical protein